MSTNEPRRILYAPTWEGFFEDSCYSSLVVMGEAMAQALGAEQGRYVVDFKSHPLTGTYDKRYLTAQNTFIESIRLAGVAGRVNDPGRTLYDYFNDCDVLIADISSVVSDFLYLNRPIIVSNPLGVDDMERAFPVSRACYVLEPNPFELTTLLQTALEGDPKAQARSQMREHILGVPHGKTAMEAFQTALTDLTQARLAPPALSREQQERAMATELKRVLAPLLATPGHSFSE